jgi:hypothetical protein
MGEIMSLIACPECAREVSDKAPSCPNCGSPIASAQEHRSIGVQLTTVQTTSKRLKSHILIAAALFWGGILWAMSAAGAAASGGGGTTMTPSLLIFAGFTWYVVTKFRIWWQHK